MHTTSSKIKADYIVIGSGAMGMAFTDVLLTETDATVVLVDKHHRPGGHWNDSYPFVRLHQPSSFYGVNSRELGSGVKDQTGWNAGLYELASGSEVCAYFDHLMQQHFLPSGRVHYFPSCEYRGEGRFASLPSGREFEAVADKKVVDATYMNVMVPSVRSPEYEVDPGVRCVPPNDLPRALRPESGYVIVGAGKTGMDACLWLLSNDVDPDAITWIMPRDSWLLDRANIQPGEFLPATVLAAARQMETIAKAGSLAVMFDALNASGQLLRLDDTVTPTMYRCATVTRAELEQLRRIRNVVRQGRVQRLTPGEIVLDQGELPSDPGKLFVDCTADGLASRPVVPVFEDERITLQSVRTCQQVFSAALIGHVEASYSDEAQKNELCTVVPHPNTDVDFLRTALANQLNQMRWAGDPELTAWLAGARLDIFSAAAVAFADPSPEAAEMVRLIAENMMPSITNMQKLLEKQGT